MRLKVIADENMPGLAQLDPQMLLERRPGRLLVPADLDGAQVLLVRSVTRVDEALLAGSSVGFVGSATIGTDHVDIDYLRRAGIRFAHAPGCNARAVAEYVLQAALIWARDQRRSLASCRIGVVGVGNVGREVRALFAALGCEVLLCDPPRQRAGEQEASAWRDLAEALRADIVTLHVPLIDTGVDATRHLFSAIELSTLTAGQLLINSCRGAVIDNLALLQRLRQPAPPAVVLDVWEQEPAVPQALFERVLRGSPHIAGYSVEGKLRGTAMVLAALHEWLGHGAWSESVPETEADYAEDVKSEAGLLSLLQRRYRLDDDHRRLGEVIIAADPAAGFDRLRRQYPPRHELSGLRLSGTVSEPLVQVLKQLGVSW